VSPSACWQKATWGAPSKSRESATPGEPRATDAFAQASVLTLYDPDRSQAVLQHGQISTWKAFVTALSTALETQHLKDGAGLRVLTETERPCESPGKTGHRAGCRGRR